MSERRKLRTYDVRCYDLAELFLSDEPKLRGHAKADELASLIQATIEDFIAYENDATPQLGISETPSSGEK